MGDETRLLILLTLLESASMKFEREITDCNIRLPL